MGSGCSLLHDGVDGGSAGKRVFLVASGALWLGDSVGCGKGALEASSNSDSKHELITAYKAVLRLDLGMLPYNLGIILSSKTNESLPSWICLKQKPNHVHFETRKFSQWRKS